MPSLVAEEMDMQFLFLGFDGIRIHTYIPDVVIFLNEGIEPVLDFVLWPSWELLGNFRPSAAHFRVVLEDEFILLICPLVIFYLGVQFVYEPLSYLLARLCTHNFGKKLPIFTDFFD